MSDNTETQLAVHVAICEERYNHIERALRDMNLAPSALSLALSARSLIPSALSLVPFALSLSKG